MKIEEMRVPFIVTTCVLVLLVASPALQQLTVLPQTQFFSEIWILGPAHRAEGYPFNITSTQNHKIFVGLGNHLGSAAYYLIELKFRNQTQSAPNDLNLASSEMPSLYNLTSVIADKGNWELPVDFSLVYSYDQALPKVNFNSLKFNDVTLNLEGYSAVWDQKNSGFFATLFFELWIYNATVQNFQYHERFASLYLNMTS